MKFNVDVIDILIRSRLINMREFDVHLAQVSFLPQKSLLYLIVGKLAKSPFGQAQGAKLMS